MARLSKKNEELLRAVQKQTARQEKTEPTLSSSSAVGLGVDLLEIDRMEKAIERTPRIVERVFTSGEREYAWSKTRPATHYAAFFAAREAVLKALGTGFAGVSYHDVEVVHDKRGKPEAVLHGNALAIAKEQGVVEIQISLSHTHHMAVASAVAIKAQSSPRKRETYDPMEELAKQFKELRTMIDDVGISDAITAEVTEEVEQLEATEAIPFASASESTEEAEAAPSDAPSEAEDGF